MKYARKCRKEFGMDVCKKSSKELGKMYARKVARN